MADNYLENKFAQLADRKKVVIKRSNPSLDSLLKKNRSCRGYDKSHVVEKAQMEEIVGVTMYGASAGNHQPLRYRIVTKGDDADFVLEHIHLGGALPQLHLPLPGTEPEAFIIACTSVPETRYVDIDLGIALQSMGLKTAEMGLSSVIICNFDKEAIQSLTGDYEPLAILAIGKGAESIFVKPISAGESTAYYRKDGVHFVPKLRPEELIIK